MKTLRDLGEFGLIARLARHLPRRAPGVLVGIGDDCAVLRAAGRNQLLLYTCDPVIEGVHYLRDTPPRQVGWKAMARNLSDIAAMGGIPRWAVVSLGLRPDTPVRYVDQLYAGLRAAAKRFDCLIVGGDTAHVQHEPFLVVAILGETERHHLALRSGARPGDVIFVTGTLGGSFAAKHLRFIPRVREARWLVSHFPIHAMLDVSDGLASELHRLREASNVELAVSARALPAPHGVTAALHDGEDFELLFTVPALAAEQLHRRWPFRLRLTEIGRVRSGQRVLLDNTPLPPKGYDHFARY